MLEISDLDLCSPRSSATSRRTYSANEMPSSAALACARRCISGSMVICMRAFMMAPSCHHLPPNARSARDRMICAWTVWHVSTTRNDILIQPSRPFLEPLYHAAVAAAHPPHCLPPHLPAPPASGRIIILAAGKAAGSMAEIAERHYVDDVGVLPSRITGVAVTRHGYARPTRIVRVLEAGHP